MTIKEVFLLVLFIWLIFGFLYETLFKKGVKMKNKIMLVCSDCNSANVSIKVWANVNEVEQHLPITNYQDTEETAYCNNCNSEQKYLNEGGKNDN